MERVVRERMSIQDTETLTPQQLINIRPVVASIKNSLVLLSCHSSWIKQTLLAN